MLKQFISSLIEFSYTQVHVLPFLMNNLTIEAASKQSGVSAKQIFDWLNQPSFRQESVSVVHVKILPNEEIGLHRDAYPQVVVALQGGIITR